MANEQPTSPTAPTSGNDAANEAPLSIREVAEASWDEVEADAGQDDQSQAGQDARARDSLGRFVSSGEQSQDPAPRIQQPASPAQAPIQPPQGVSNEPPAHWPAEDKATFARLPQEGQQFLLKRHAAMEADYTAKTQAAAAAVDFTQALAPVFQDPVIARSLANVDGRPLPPAEAIKQWAAFHYRAVTDPTGLVKDLIQRLQVDPAAVFGQVNQPPAGLSAQDMADPAIKYFADHVGKTAQEVQSLRSQLQNFQWQQQEAAKQETLRVTRWGIDSFADEKDQQGRPLHPHFDAVLPHMVELFQANPNRDLREAYETAVWMHPQLRSSFIQQERQTIEQKQANQRASMAARGNVRGRTSPVARPDAPDGQPKSMRSIIAAAADEVGL